MPYKRKALNITGSNLWYLVGLITSDGCLSKDGRHIDITSKDYEFLKGIKNLIGLGNKIGIKYGYKKQKAFRIQIANRSFYDFLLSLGLTHKKSLTVGALDVPRQFFVDFLRGLIDGDGSMRSWKHHTNFRQQWSLRIYSGSKKFLEWLDERIREDLKACGRLYQYNKYGTAYVLKFGKMAAQAIVKRCYYKDCFGLDRKIKLAMECCSSKIGWHQSKTVLN